MKTVIAYKRDSKGNLRSWQAEIDGSRYRTIAGLVDGKLVVSEWTVCIGKQKRTDAEQAQFESEADFRNKIDREYRINQGELDSVPPSPMLAKKYEDERSAVVAAFMSGVGVYSQPKLDGIRAFISRHGAFSREYQRHLNVDHILAALAPVFVQHPEAIFDGELYNHDLKDDFNKIASVVRKQKPDEAQRAEAAKLMQYHVYDLASSTERFGVRHASLVSVLPAVESIVAVQTRHAKTQEELDALNGAYVEAGYEGQMVRLDALYETDKRSKFLLKRKEFQSAEYPILRVEEGVGNWAGYAKRVIYRMSDGGEGKAGMRGTQTFAKELLGIVWKPESTVTVRYFGFTPDGAHRFPVATDFQQDGRRD